MNALNRISLPIQDCGEDDDKEPDCSPASSPSMAMNLIDEDDDDDDNRCGASRGSASVPSSSLMSSQSMVVAAAAAAAAVAVAGRYSPQDQHSKATAAAVAHINGTSEYISFKTHFFLSKTKPITVRVTITCIIVNWILNWLNILY